MSPPKIDFDWEDQLERDVIEDLGGDSLSIPWVTPLKVIAEAGAWQRDDDIDKRNWNKQEYLKIQAEGTYHEFDEYWNEKMRRQKAPNKLGAGPSLGDRSTRIEFRRLSSRSIREEL